MTLRWMISLSKTASVLNLKNVNLKMLTCAGGPMKRGMLITKTKLSIIMFT